MSVWFTSDTHFGHAKVIEHCSRPFANVHEMNDAMIKRWNARVAPTDTIYHLGDFAFSDHVRFLSNLNGHKRLILGNHDKPKYLRFAEHLWEAVNYMETINVDGTSIVLCHYSMRVWNKSHHGSLHLYGHSHGNLPGDAQSLDAGVDCWDFQPVSLDEIRARMATLPSRKHPDHHRPKGEE